MLIASATYFNLCTGCGKHGHIQTSDGEEGSEVATIKGALVSLEKLRAAGKITKDEIPELRRQIEVSNLPFEDKEREDTLTEFFALEEELDSLHERIRELFGNLSEDQEGNLETPREFDKHNDGASKKPSSVNIDGNKTRH